MLNINKKKIINDPVFGFINLQSEFVFDLIEHPFFQRLRRIKQLGLSCLVFPGATHTRFEHALGAAYLMNQAVSSLKNKGNEITDEEAEAVTIAILLHDIGHAPFSHVLENTLANILHEEMSLLLMEALDREFNGRINLAIKIFKNQYHKKFLFQLVSSQLDVDRLDYLGRDSFFTGVVEGKIGVDRIIKMLNVCDDKLVVEQKGIYSIEKFLIARRLMYWQVYLHKTVVSAEFMLINILKRAKMLVLSGETVFSTPPLRVFLENNFNISDFTENYLIGGLPLLSHYTRLDDNDILASVKEWQNHNDKTLAYLSKKLINRQLFGVETSNNPFPDTRIAELKSKIKDYFMVTNKEASFFYVNQELTNSAYSEKSGDILILSKKGKLKNIHDASDINLSALSTEVKKFFLCFPKELDFI